ncbi:MAG: hypothetical protein AAF191_05005 [Verrucomicrobiota bacterium]
MEPDVYHEAVRDVMSTPQSVRGIILVASIMIGTMLSAVGAILAFLFTMTFFRIPEDHRDMRLGRIWFIMIPVFGVYWLYVTVMKLADSFRLHFAAALRDDPQAPVPAGDYGKKWGLAMVITAAIAHLSVLMAFVTQSSLLVGIIIGTLAMAVAGFSLLYFLQVFRIRKLIPDPELEIAPESYL